MAIDYEKEKYWYLIQTVKGMEHRCEDNIKKRIVSLHLEDYVFQTLIPTGTRQKVNAKGETKEEVFCIYPGYIFIEMIVTDKTWYDIRNTQLVTGFLGSSGGGAKPVPVPKEEMIPILKSCGMELDVKLNFNVGDTVRILGGPFKMQTGVVESIDKTNQTVSVLVEFFGGRQTSTSVRFDEVEPE